MTACGPSLGDMIGFSGVAERFMDLHVKGSPLVMPNPWDAGSARLLASLGFEALATTSSGHAATLGRLDGGVGRDEALAHAAALAAAVDVPVSADLEHGFADDPPGVAEAVRQAAATGLAGCSIEDSTQRPDEPIYELGSAVDRVRAAVEAAHGALTPIVLTARAESLLYGRDLRDVIARLQAFEEAGADVLFAPGLASLADVREVVREVDAPVNVLLRSGGPTVAELADVGVARVSVGGGLAWVALGAVVEAAEELLHQGSHEFWSRAEAGRRAARRAFGGAE